MKIKFKMIIISIVVLLAAAVLPQAGEDNDPFMTAFGSSRYIECGLNKLSPSERMQLHGLITGAAIESFLDISAAAFMEKDGWSRISVLGAVPSDEGIDEKHILIGHQYELFILDPPIVPYLPEPGVYWAKNSGSSWTIIYPDGGTYDFWGKAIKCSRSGSE